MADGSARINQIIQAVREPLAGIAALGVAVFGYFADLAAFLTSRGVGENLSQFVAGVLIFALVGFALWMAARRIYRSSRLLRPEAFELRATRPEDLIGREQDVADLAGLVADNRLVFLIGESGAGKSALVSIGLVPRLQAEGRFLPILISNYGSNWVDGPLREALFSLRAAATLEERETFGLPNEGAPAIAPDALGEILAGAAARAGRLPLLIFDQFDDYQARHRARFLSGRKEWITAAKLCQRNPFWRAIGKALDAGCHMLVITRTDTASGLDSIRLEEPASRPLDRVTGGQLIRLLNQLAPPDATPPIISDPDNGWNRLKVALAHELERDGAFLPQQLRIVLLGLSHLNTLTTGRLRRVGGTSGLEALFVGEAIAAAARLAQVPESAVRELLVQLVDGIDPGLRTGRRTDAVLAASVPDSEARAAALGELARREVVRGVPNAETGEVEWQLDHDYLARAVVAAERARNREVTRLRDGEAALERAGGDFWPQWRSLLSPIEQVTLAVARLRGTFRYGPYRRYACLSLLRVVPMALVAVGLAVTGILGWREWQIRTEVVRIVDGLSVDEQRGAAATLGLWAAPPAFRDRVQTAILSNSHRLLDLGSDWAPAIVGGETARAAALVAALLDRLEGTADPAVRRALLGALDAVGWRLNEAGAAQFFPAVRQRLTSTTDVAERRALFLALERVGSKLSGTIAAQEFLPLSEALTAFAQPVSHANVLFSIGGIARRPNLATQLTGGSLCSGIRPIDDNDTVERLALITFMISVGQQYRLVRTSRAFPLSGLGGLGGISILSGGTGFGAMAPISLNLVNYAHDNFGVYVVLDAVAGRLTAAMAAQQAKALRERLANATTPAELRALLLALDALAASLDAAQAALEVSALRDQLATTMDLDRRIALLVAIDAMGGKLDEATAALVFSALHDRLASTNDQDERFALLLAIGTLGGRLHQTRAALEFTALRQRLIGTVGIVNRLALLPAIQAVGERLDEATAAREAELLRKELTASTDPAERCSLLYIISTLGGRLEAPAAAREFSALRNQLAITPSHNPEFAILTHAIAVMGGRLDAATAAHEASALRERLAEAPQSQRQVLLYVYRALGTRLDSEAARREMAALRRRLSETTSAADRCEPLSGIAAVAAQLDAAAAAREIAALRERLKGDATSDLCERSMLIMAISAVGARLDSRVAAREAIALRAQLTATMDPAERVNLLVALAWLATNMDEAAAERELEALRRLLATTVAPNERRALGNAILTLIHTLTASAQSNDSVARSFLELVADPYFLAPAPFGAPSAFLDGRAFRSSLPDAGSLRDVAIGLLERPSAIEDFDGMALEVASRYRIPWESLRIYRGPGNVLR